MKYKEVYKQWGSHAKDIEEALDLLDQLDDSEAFSYESLELIAQGLELLIKDKKNAIDQLHYAIQDLDGPEELDVITGECSPQCECKRG
jgi:hypothetical protein